MIRKALFCTCSIEPLCSLVRPGCHTIGCKVLPSVQYPIQFPRHFKTICCYAKFMEDKEKGPNVVRWINEACRQASAQDTIK